MNEGGRKELAIDATGTRIEIEPHATRVYIYNSGTEYIYVATNETALTGLVASIAAETALPIAPKASLEIGIVEQQSVATVLVATATGETSTADIGWY